MFLIKFKIIFKLIELTLKESKIFKFFRRLFLYLIYRKTSAKRIQFSLKSLSSMKIDHSHFDSQEENNHYSFIMAMNLYMIYFFSLKVRNLQKTATKNLEKREEKIRKKVSNILDHFFKKYSIIKYQDQSKLPYQTILFMPHIGSYQLSVIHLFTYLLSKDKDALLILIVQDEEHQKTADVFHLVDSRITILSDKNSFMQIRRLTKNTQKRVCIVVLYDINPVIYKHREQVSSVIYSPFFDKKIIVFDHIFKFGKIFKMPITLAYTPIIDGKLCMFLEKYIDHSIDPELFKHKAMLFLQEKIRDNPFQWKFLPAIEKYSYQPWQERPDLVAAAQIKKLDEKLRIKV